MTQKRRFQQLTPAIRDELLNAGMTASEWRLWAYLVTIDPFGDGGVDYNPEAAMEACKLKKSTYFSAKAKFQRLGWFDFQDGKTKVVNLKGYKRLQDSGVTLQDSGVTLQDSGVTLQDSGVTLQDSGIGIYIDRAHSDISDITDKSDISPPTPSQGEEKSERIFGFEIPQKEANLETHTSLKSESEKLGEMPSNFMGTYVPPAGSDFKKAEYIHPAVMQEMRLKGGLTVRQQRQVMAEAIAHPSLVYSENAPWLESNSTPENLIFHSPFINWGAVGLMKEFGKPNMAKAKADYKAKLVNDPRKISFEWQAFQEETVHKAAVVAARLNNGINVGQDELNTLSKHQRAFVGITPESTENIDPKILESAKTPASIPQSLDNLAPEGAESAEAYKAFKDQELRDYWANQYAIAQQTKHNVQPVQSSAFSSVGQIAKTDFKQVKADRLEKRRIDFWNNQLRSGNPNAIAIATEQALSAGYRVIDGQVEDVEF